MAGKTAICERLIHDTFSNAYEPTVDNDFKKSLSHFTLDDPEPNPKAMINIRDVSGSDAYAEMHEKVSN